MLSPFVERTSVLPKAEKFEVLVYWWWLGLQSESKVSVLITYLDHWMNPALGSILVIWVLNAKEWFNTGAHVLILNWFKQESKILEHVFFDNSTGFNSMTVCPSGWWILEEFEPCKDPTLFVQSFVWFLRGTLCMDVGRYQILRQLKVHKCTNCWQVFTFLLFMFLKYWGYLHVP